MGSVDQQLQGQSLAIIVRFMGWSDQGEVDVLRSDLCRTGRREQSVSKFLAAVRFREPPCGGIDQSQPLHCGQVRLALAQDCHGGQALPMGDYTWAAGGPHDRLIIATEHRSGQLQRPGQVQLVKGGPVRLVKDSRVGAELVIQVMRPGSIRGSVHRADRGVGREAGKVTQGVAALGAALPGPVFGEAGGC